MKKLLLTMIAMILLTANVASAAWTAVGETDNYITYVDLATINKSGNMVKMWTLMDFKDQQTLVEGSYQSAKIQYEFKCKEEQRRYLTFSWFFGKMGKGEVVYTNSDVGEWRPIGPDSVDETLWEYACIKE